MKIRNDFVTNSSSSSFLISFKEPENETEKKWFNLVKDIIVNSEGGDTSEGLIMRTEEEVSGWLKKNYLISTRGDCFEDAEKKIWDASHNGIKDGKTLVQKYIDNDDMFFVDIIKAFSTGDFGIKLEYSDCWRLTN